MNNTITISRKEYQNLQRQAKAYRQLAGKIFESALSGSIEEIVQDFRSADLYSEAFLKDLESGLRKSSIGKR